MARHINKYSKLHKLNAAQALKLGYEEGLKESNIRGLEAAQLVMVLAYHNVIDEYVKTPKTQENLIKAVETELNRLFNEEFRDIDHIGVAIERMNDVRRHFKMEPIEWDTPQPQPVTTAGNAVYKKYLEGN